MYGRRGIVHTPSRWWGPPAPAGCDAEAREDPYADSLSDRRAGGGYRAHCACGRPSETSTVIRRSSSVVRARASVLAAALGCALHPPRRADIVPVLIKLPSEEYLRFA